MHIDEIVSLDKPDSNYDKYWKLLSLRGTPATVKSRNVYDGYVYKNHFFYKDRHDSVKHIAVPKVKDKMTYNV